MAIVIGPTFADELAAAGLLGLPFSWGSDGVQGRDNLTETQRDALDAVIAAHDPTKLRKNVVQVYVFLGRWTNAEYASLMQKRALAISAGNVALVQQWDIAAAKGVVDLNTPAAIALKNALVTAAVLTQARADVIFNGF